MGIAGAAAMGIFHGVSGCACRKRMDVIRTAAYTSMHNATVRFQVRVTSLSVSGDLVGMTRLLYMRRMAQAGTDVKHALLGDRPAAVITPAAAAARSSSPPS